jgi:tryptophanase
MELPFAEPYKIKMVEQIHRSTREEREKWIVEAKYNLFNLKSQHVFVDLLTDSGTGAMSDRQWSSMMVGDESYAGATSYYNLKNAIEKILGFLHFLPTHQGRGAENVLFSVLVKEGHLIPGNSHFDTTKGHIEIRKAHAVDLTINEASQTQLEIPFKGNVDIEKLKRFLETTPKEKIPIICMTLTNNTAGGQPVSMENLRETSKLAKAHGIPVLFDSARFAENAYFIKVRESGYASKTIKEIVTEMFQYADFVTMSSKKDAIVNIGGFIAFKDHDVYQQATVYNIMYEGFITYGGMSGRDMNALAVGLDENTEFAVLDARIRQVAYLAKRLDEYGVPYQRPAGGHAIFIDALRMLPNVPREEFPAQTLGIEIYLEAGVRGVEIGAVLADRDPETRENRFPALESLRLAIPRRTYTNNHMDLVAVALKNVFDRRDKINRGLIITKEAPILRHFTCEFERL